MPFRCRLLVPILAAAAALAGCGGVGGNPFGRAEAVNPTDKAFVRAMMKHERAVGSMTDIGRRKALRVELRGIARDRLARHSGNLRDLGWFDRALRGRRISLLSAYIRQGPPDYRARELRGAVSFDHEFLVRMIQQLEYAVATTAVERERGGDPRLKALARQIHEESRKDLAKLRHWLRTWYGDDTQRGLPPGGQAPGPQPGPPGGGSGAPAPARTSDLGPRVPRSVQVPRVS